MRIDLGAAEVLAKLSATASTTMWMQHAWTGRGNVLMYGPIWR
jgi:hypothetical protein